MRLDTIRTLLIDGDGVLWQSTEAMPGFVRFFDMLAEFGIQWGLLTNNATPTLADYVAKFSGFGVTTSQQQIFSSASVTGEYLRQRFGAGASVYVIGQPGLKQTLVEAGFQISDGETQPPHANAVVVGIDRQISYGKLAAAMRLIRAGSVFIATNGDTTFPTPEGLMPGAGSIVAAVAAAAGQQPEMMGKPEPTMFQVAMARMNADPETTAMLGDRLDTDILGAQRFGLKTILVLSGVTSRADLAQSAIQPDYVAEDIATLTLELRSAVAGNGAKR